MSEPELVDPYNSLNNEITLNDIQSILKKYNVPPIVNNIALYQRAFVHKSYTKSANDACHLVPVENNIPLKSKSNERLEFLGDGVLELVAKYYLYRRFPNQNEGFMTEKKIAIVKNEAIGLIAYEMGLHKWLLLSQFAEEKKTRTNLKKLGCLLEAFIGAIFLDFNKITIKDEEKWFETIFVTGPGFQIAQKFIEGIFETHINWTDLIKNDDNYKNILQVKIQKEFKVTPHYIEISHDDFGYNMGVYLCIGDNIHSQNIKDAISIDQFQTFDDIHSYISRRNSIFICLGYSQHKIKRKAEQMACQLILEKGVVF
jgi:dsRNA-specific ribonuclease